ncbi:MAG: hypothetical protein ABEJ42_07855 [Halobacteriaceae archaeon]
MNARAAAAVVGGGLVALVGAGGSVLLALGWLLGRVDVSLVHWLLPAALVIGGAVLAWGLVQLAGDLLGGDLLGGEGPAEALDGVGLETALRFLD